MTPPQRRSVSVASQGMMGILLIVGLVGCSTAQNVEMLELEETVEISPLEDQPYVAASEDGPAQNVREPEIPEEARENTPAGAKATVEYFWQGIDYVRLTGEAGPAASVAHYMCDICTDVIFRWQQIYEDGAWAALHGESELEMVETQSYSDEEREDEWTAVIFNVTEPASDFFIDGELVEGETLDEETLDGWWAELTYDEANQQWQIEWIDQDDSLTG